MTTPDHLTRLTGEQLSAAFESACNIAAQQYVDGCDTTVIDAEVDRLSAELDRREAA